MFDIGFWEIALISIIGLVVLGPERLPVAIRSVMKWINTAKSMANSVKSEISQELNIQEMNENMVESTKKGLTQLDPDLQKTLDEMKKAAKELVQPYQGDTKAAKEAIQQQKIAPSTTAATTTIEQDTTSQGK